MCLPFRFIPTGVILAGRDHFLVRVGLCDAFSLSTSGSWFVRTPMCRPVRLPTGMVEETIDGVRVRYRWNRYGIEAKPLSLFEDASSVIDHGRFELRQWVRSGETTTTHIDGGILCDVSRVFFDHP